MGALIGINEISLNPSTIIMQYQTSTLMIIMKTYQIITQLKVLWRLKCLTIEENITLTIENSNLTTKDKPVKVQG